MANISNPARMPGILICLLCFILLPLSGAAAQSAGKITSSTDHPELIEKAQSYLQNLDTLRANFTQITPQGRHLKGTFFLNRPGKLRFEYQGLEDFVVADGTFIYFYDSEIGSQSHAPIQSTLAHFLLREKLSLKEDIIIRSSFEDGRHFIMTLVKSEDPEAGALTLVFDKKSSKESMELKEWIVKDSQKNLTKVMLEDIEKDVALDSSLFIYHDPESGKPVYNE